jgi:hypothetical protein
MNKQNKLQAARQGYTPEQKQPFGDVGADHLSQLAALKKGGAAIQRQGGGRLTIHRCEASAAGLVVPGDISRQELYDLATDLFAMESSIALWCGDMLVAFDDLGYGDISQIAGEFGRAAKTLSNWKAVCGAVTTSLRREVVAAYPDARPLSFTHYALLVTLPEEAQFQYASRAMAEGWSVQQLREAIYGVNAPASGVETWRDRLTDNVEKVAKRFRKAKSGKEKREWITLAQEQVEVWQQLAEDMKREL